MSELVKDVVADGVVDAAEVVQIRDAFYADGKIDKDEADSMFEINDAVSGNDNDASYEGLFVDVISDFVLKDEKTPGVIDAEEGDYLVSKIEGDGEIDDVEKALLLNIKSKATEIQSESLNKLIDSLN